MQRFNQVVALGCLMFLSSCSSVNEQNRSNDSIVKICTDNYGNVIECSKVHLQAKKFDQNYQLQINNASKENMGPNAHQLDDASKSVQINEYIEQLAVNLAQNNQDNGEFRTIGVVPLVDLSYSLNEGNYLGQLIAESFITELQNNNYIVVDYRLADTVRSGKSTDLVYVPTSKLVMLPSTMTHVLTGTMSYMKTGIQLNVRIVDFQTKRVVSAGSKLIPYFLLDSILPLSS